MSRRFVLLGLLSLVALTVAAVHESSSDVMKHPYLRRYVEKRSHAQFNTSAAWDYLDTTKWTANYPVCGGNSQSPINLLQATAISQTQYLAWDAFTGNSTIGFNGKTAEVSTHDSTLRWGDKSWDLAQFHVHTPSEHTIDGASIPLELHAVHTDNTSVTVLALFFQPLTNASTQKQANFMEPFYEGAKTLAASNWTHTHPELFDHMDHMLVPMDGFNWNDVASAFDGQDLWSYTGSYTTPPCTQGVNWLLASAPLYIPQAWITQIAAVVGKNNRPTQMLNGRTVTKIKQQSFQRPAVEVSVNGAPPMTTDFPKNQPFVFSFERSDDSSSSYLISMVTSAPDHDVRVFDVKLSLYDVRKNFQGKIWKQATNSVVFRLSESDLAGWGKTVYVALVPKGWPRTPATGTGTFYIAPSVSSCSS